MIRALAIVKKSIPAAELAFSGRGADEQEFRKLAESLGVASSVKFLGFLDQAKLVEVMNAGKVFAITSTSDTQSMVMMQAMACGLPVVGVRARALPEYIHKQNGFVVEPNDPTAMGERLAYLLKNKTAAQTLGKGARKYAERFGEAAIAADWEKIYMSVIESYNKRRHWFDF